MDEAEWVDINTNDEDNTTIWYDYRSLEDTTIVVMVMLKII